MSNKAISVYAEALKREEEENQSTRNVTSIPTQVRDEPRTPSRESSRKESHAASRETSRDKPRANPRDLPSRDDIQEFSFRLRDELKVKVQAEVPHYWQQELDDLARELDVKKLELYRYIIGEFLGKVRRKRSP